MERDWLLNDVSIWRLTSYTNKALFPLILHTWKDLTKYTTMDSTNCYAKIKGKTGIFRRFWPIQKTWTTFPGVFKTMLSILYIKITKCDFVPWLSSTPSRDSVKQYENMEIFDWIMWNYCDQNLSSVQINIVTKYHCAP